ncbi:hypothetical protein BD311DRAFT_797872 [Dichomitus squalens]|uniref:F-box domain-containing protein n=1 Tax=Dichomitus squalens TaxID=114155 RepID=A0A4Q9MIT2_9APHY|nr:hypothetical protein BD311DRAFT_797872 [Dichomitus squalens]
MDASFVHVLAEWNPALGPPSLLREPQTDWFDLKPSRRRTPSICFDVLVMLFDLLHTRPDVFALMCTCKTLYAAGARRLLQFEVLIKSDRALVSFGHFMLDGILGRAPLQSLRRLELEICLLLRKDDPDESSSESESSLLDAQPDLEYEADAQLYEEYLKERLQGMPFLVEILRGAPLLKVLSIFEAEELLERGEGTELASAIAGLQTLRSLRIHSFGLRSLALLQRIRAPLVEVDIDYWFPCSHYFRPDTIELLAPFCDTLAVVTLWWTEFAAEPVKRDLRTTPQFPRVRSLVVRGFHAGCDVALLMHLFPNLEHLEMTDLEDWPAMDLQEVHDTNMDVPAEHVWNLLQHVCGDLTALHVLGLNKHVERVDVADVHLLLWAAYHLDEVLDGLRPSKLLMRVGYSLGPYEDVEHDAEQFSELFYWEDHVKEGLTHLALDVKDRFARELGVDFVTIILGLLQSLPALEFFILRVRPNALAGSPEEDKRAEAQQEQGNGSALVQDWDACLREFAASCGPLEFIALDVVGRDPRYARAVENEEGFTLEYLDPEEGAAIIEEEDMQWCRRVPFPHPARPRWGLQAGE